MIDLVKKMMHLTDANYSSNSIIDNLQSLPIHVHCKDKKGRYIDFNDRVLVDSGLSKFTDLQGLTDLDFIFLQEGEAQKIRDRDEKVIVKDSSDMHMGSLSLYNNITAQEVSIKNPLRSKFTKKIIGVMTCAFVLREPNLFSKEFSKKNSDMRFLNDITHNINDEYPQLSKRETQCLELYLSGESGKETALILGLSHRTVEDYINNIKKKLKCNRKRDLLKLFSCIK